MPQFSIVIPVYNGEEVIGRALQSCISQTLYDWEVIVIDDGSTDDTKRIVSEFMKRSRRIRMFVLPENNGRLVARNIGMKLVQGEWICWLDADDEFMSNYLEVLSTEIDRNPNFKIFNFGSLFKEREVIDGRRFEKGWRLLPPLELKETDKGMESFEKGHITSGCWIFRKELLGGQSFFPEAKTPYGLEGCYPSMLVQKDKRFKEICKQNEEGHWLPLGNPWGDDYSFFWWITRENKSKCLPVILHIHHTRI